MQLRDTVFSTSYFRHSIILLTRKWWWKWTPSHVEPPNLRFTLNLTLISQLKLKLTKNHIRTHALCVVSIVPQRHSQSISLPHSLKSTINEHYSISTHVYLSTRMKHVKCSRSKISTRFVLRLNGERLVQIILFYSVWTKSAYSN